MAYLAILIVVAGIGIGMSAVGTKWQTASQREKEKELLFVGEEFRRAISQYYLSSPGAGQYPRTLEDLLLDRRHSGERRYLRRIYRDPFTGQHNWVIIQSPDGGIIGVHSLGLEVPIKQTGFAGVTAGFKDRSSYREWAFVYYPQEMSRR
jgi:type II secretory pathway pseudopilin PulG